MSEQANNPEYKQHFPNAEPNVDAAYDMADATRDHEEKAKELRNKGVELMVHGHLMYGSDAEVDRELNPVIDELQKNRREANRVSEEVRNNAKKIVN